MGDGDPLDFMNMPGVSTSPFSVFGVVRREASTGIMSTRRTLLSNPIWPSPKSRLWWSAGLKSTLGSQRGAPKGHFVSVKRSIWPLFPHEVCIFWSFALCAQYENRTVFLSIIY